VLVVNTYNNFKCTFKKHNTLISIILHIFFDSENTTDNHTLRLWWWFPTGHVEHSEEYLIFDTIALVMFVASTLGLSIGFSFSGLISYVIDYIQNPLIILEYR